LGRGGGLRVGAGVRGQLAIIPGELEPFYGGRVPLGGVVFLRLAVAPMSHAMPIGHAMPMGHTMPMDHAMP